MRLLSSMEGIWCQDGNTLLSVSCTLTEGKIKFYIVAEAGLKTFRSSCLLAMDVKTGSSSVIRCWDHHSSDWLCGVSLAMMTQPVPTHVWIQNIYKTLAGETFPKDNYEKLHCGTC